MKNWILTGLAILVMAAGGCSKKESGTSTGSAGSTAGINLSASIESLKEAAAKMDLASLEKTAQKYVDEIAAKQSELKKLMDQFSAIPLAEKMGEKAKALQDDITKLTGTISQLTERLQVYLDSIKEKGGDISKYTLPKS